MKRIGKINMISSCRQQMRKRTEQRVRPVLCLQGEKGNRQSPSARCFGGEGGCHVSVLVKYLFFQQMRMKKKSFALRTVHLFARF